jgi:hypothetical protein
MCLFQLDDLKPIEPTTQNRQIQNRNKQATCISKDN